MKGAQDRKSRRIVRSVPGAAFGGDGHEVSGRVQALCFHEPAGLVGVGHGFGGGEGFRNHQPEGGLGIDPGNDAAEVMDVHIGQKMQAHPLVGHGFQGAGHAFRGQIGPTDADHHHVAEGFAARPDQLAGVDGRRKFPDLFEHPPDFRRNIQTVHQQRCSGQVPGGGVQGGSFFSGVDDLAGRHGPEAPADFSCFRQFVKQGHDGTIHPLPGKIIKEIGPREGKIRQTVGCGGQLPQVHIRPGHDLCLTRQPPPDIQVDQGKGTHDDYLSGLDQASFLPAPGPGARPKISSIFRITTPLDLRGKPALLPSSSIQRAVSS